jgi:uncharacterized membrane protein HdeD (DUF308 family)
MNMVDAKQSTNEGSGALVIASALGDHWRLFLIEGLILMILGAAAIVLPQVASLAVETILGWLLLIGGGIGLATTIMARSAPGFWWALASSIASIVAGALLIGWPIRGVVSLTFILTAFLVVDGLFMIMYGLEHRQQLSQRWGWLVVNGVLDLLLAAIIIVALPGSAVWALGLLIGIDMLFGGSSLIAIAMKARPK